MLDRSSSFSASHFEYPPITGEEKPPGQSRASLAGKEHIGQGPTIAYNVQYCSRFRFRTFCASDRVARYVPFRY
jgi:hypothetical protein